MKLLLATFALAAAAPVDNEATELMEPRIGQVWDTHGPVAGAPAGCHCSHINCQNLVRNTLTDKQKASKWGHLCKTKECCGCGVCVNNKYAKGASLTEFFKDSPCNTTPPKGTWQLAMNLNTGDGNVLDYCNNDFWTSASALGGASDTDELSDYKNLAAYTTPAKEIMIIVHEEGKAVGWRVWKDDTNKGKSIHDYMQNGYTALASEANANKFGTTTGGDNCNLVANEPMVKNTVSGKNSHEVLYLNTYIGDLDLNRFSVKEAGDGGNYNNLGWGLGTAYDGTTANPYCGTIRPMNDAQMHTTVHHWGSGGGVGGMIGSDSKCNGGCPWTKSSGYNYDYAIYIAAA